jgi:hypothetical protein
MDALMPGWSQPHSTSVLTGSMAGSVTNVSPEQWGQGIARFGWGKPLPPQAVQGWAL